MDGSIAGLREPANSTLRARTACDSWLLEVISPMAHLLGGGWGQLGPDSGPSLLAKHLSRDLPTGGSLDAARFRRVHVAAPGQALIQVLLVHAHFGGNFASDFWSDVATHREPFCRNAIFKSSVMTLAEC